ncbi:hypothetical protein WA026_002025 [Henosepilachna vigintioctopunctata]|uniref:RHD domain-containing protein n=1 Tax=Henosepilachna vigintioctopunctata TaxID=420089 RepID=A0AAW1URL9_9CUCU
MIRIPSIKTDNTVHLLDIYLVLSVSLIRYREKIQILIEYKIFMKLVECLEIIWKSNSKSRQAYVRIIEEPAPKALRFRYECEGRSAGSIPGASSTPENKTFPTIQVVGYQGRAVVVVSCVTKDEPYRPHPHNLVGRDGCKRGVCTLEIPTETMMIQFCNLGIQCVKKKDIEAALRTREEIRVDPFRTGFGHKNQPTSIDLNSVRLCFQVFLEGDKRGKFTIPLQPKVSQPIYDKKAMSDLVIVKLSDCFCRVDGDKEMMLFCEKVAKEDIQIRFFEEKDGLVVWEGYADFQPSQVHKQVGIAFKPPRYRNQEVTNTVKVFLHLKRPSDGVTSEPLPFQYLPISNGRKRFKDDSVHTLSNDFNIKMEPKDITYQWPHGASLEIMQTDSNAFKMPFLAGLPPLPPTAAAFVPIPSTSTGLPPMSSINSNIPHQNWNIFYNPSEPSAQPINPTDVDANNLHCLLDMDSHQNELRQINLNSGELGTFEGGVDVANLSENLTTNLSLTENNNCVNMTTDSFTRLANNTIDSICPGYEHV